MNQSELQPDFPAAHSMDTTWFAVDKHGHLGVFDSGEDGAVPDAFSYEYGIQSEDYFRAISGIEFDFFVDDLVEDAAKNRRRPILIFDWRSKKFKSHKLLEQSCYECLLLFEGELPDHPGLIPLPHSKYKLAFIETLEASTAKDWRRERGLKNIFMGKSWTDFRAGLYLFQNDLYGGYPYILDRKPKAHIKLSQLPESMQQQFSAITFEDFDFSEVRAFQPLEHMKCAVWGATWVDMNGTEHDRD